MEYLGYIAANHPPPNHYPRRPPCPPARANSTTAVPAVARSRFAAHRKTNSSDSAASREAASALQLPAGGEGPAEAASREIAPAPHSPSSPPPPAPPTDGLLRRPRPPYGLRFFQTRSPCDETATASSPSTTSRSFSSSTDIITAFATATTATTAATATTTATTATTTATTTSPLHHADAVPAMFPEPRLYNRPLMSVNASSPGTAAGRTPSTTPTALSSTASVARSESTASTLAATATLNSSKTTMASSEPPSSAEGTRTSQSLLAHPGQSKPFAVRNGRTYLADPSLPYPLPVDLPELHRQSLRTLFFFQLFGGPVCSPAFDTRPPTRVLEIGCGSGFWSLMCNQFYARQGHRGISFTGMDVAPIGQGASSVSGKSRSRYTTMSSSSSLSSATDKARKDNNNNTSTSSGSSTSSNSIRDSKDSKASGASKDARDSRSANDPKDKNSMNWRFVQHDLRRMPWPFADEEFDLVMIKDMSMSIRTETYQAVIEECIRILQPGGTLELWDSDHTIRILRPHVPEPAGSASADDDDDDLDIAISAGAYIMTANTPLSAPVNHYIDEFNGWVSKALQARSLSFVPCALAKAMFYQEADALTGAGSRRLAVPLSEVKWEREGVGGVVTKDGKTYVETKGKGRDSIAVVAASASTAEPTPVTRKTMTRAQSALRHTALLTVVQMIQSLEPLLREVSGKSQDEWDSWSGKMMNDLLKENGTYMGECLEVGAWWAQKR